MLVEVISAIIVGIIFYQEIPQLINLLGGLLIAISCVLVLRGSCDNIANYRCMQMN